MSDNRVLLSKEQIDSLSTQLIKELDYIRPWQYNEKEKLVSKFLKEAQRIILNNIKTFINTTPKCDVKTLIAKIGEEILLTPNQYY